MRHTRHPNHVAMAITMNPCAARTHAGGGGKYKGISLLNESIYITMWSRESNIARNVAQGNITTQGPHNVHWLEATTSKYFRY